MLNHFNKFQKCYKIKSIKFINPLFEPIFYKFNFTQLINTNNAEIFQQYERYSKKIIIKDHYQDSDGQKYIFLCFD